MAVRGICHLRLQRDRARIGHHIHIQRLARIGIEQRGLSVFPTKEADAKILVNDIAHVRHDARAGERPKSWDRCS